MATDYSIDGTTKVQRERIISDGLAISTLDAPPPTAETMALMRKYIDGKLEIREVLRLTIERYTVAHA